MGLHLQGRDISPGNGRHIFVEVCVSSETFKKVLGVRFVGATKEKSEHTDSLLVLRSVHVDFESLQHY